MLFKKTSNIKDWESLFKTYTKGIGIILGNEKSVYDSYLGDKVGEVLTFKR